MRWIVVGLTAALAASGCREVLGIENVTAEPPVVVPYVDPECATCVQQSCAAEEQACAVDATCLERLTCLAACAPRDVGCRVACEDGGRGGLLEALERCRRGRCTATCFDAGGGLVDALEGDLCSGCFDAACGEQITRCITSGLDDPNVPIGECERQWWCQQQGPPDPARSLACSGGYPHRDGALNRLQMCRQDTCPTECSFGRHWECIGQYSWPEPTTSPILYELFFIGAPNGFLKFRPHTAALDVAACAPDDCASCTQPLATWSYQPDAPALLPLDVSAGPFTGCVEAVGEGRGPLLHYFGHPVSANEGRATAAVWFDFRSPAVIGLLESLDLHPKDGLGHLLVEIYDCLGDRAPGIQFEIDVVDEATEPYYLQGTYLYPETQGAVTMFDGGGGFINVPPGKRTVQARRADTGKVVSHVTVEVRPDWITTVWMYPTPAADPGGRGP